MPSPLSTGLSILQQGIEDAQKAREEAQKAEAQSAGNRTIMNGLVNAGIWGDKEVIEYNKGSARQRNDMIAGGARALVVKNQLEDQQMQREAAARATEQLALQRKSGELELAKYQRSAFEYAAQEKAKQEQQAALAEHVRRGPQLTDKGGVTFELTPTGDYRPVTPPTPTVPIPVPGGTPIPVPVTSQQGQEELASLNPARQIYNKYGLEPEHFLPKNVEFGELPFNNPKLGFDPASPNKTHARIQGTVMPVGDYNAWIRKLADKGQLPEQVTLPTGQVVKPRAAPTPAPTAQAGSGGGGYKLDPTNPKDMAVVHMLLDKNNGDIDKAKEEAAAMGLTWL